MLCRRLQKLEAKVVKVRPKRLDWLLVRVPAQADASRMRSLQDAAAEQGKPLHTYSYELAPGAHEWEVDELPEYYELHTLSASPSRWAIEQVRKLRGQEIK